MPLDFPFGKKFSASLACTQTSSGFRRGGNEASENNDSTKDWYNNDCRFFGFATHLLSTG